MQFITKHSKLILIILCAVLALALIIVSAFAYQWHGDLKDVKTKYRNLRAVTDESTISSMTNEISNLSMQVAEYEARIAENDKTIQEYKTILEENGLLLE